MTGEIGQLALCLALALSVVMAGAGLAGLQQAAVCARAVASSAATGLPVFIALALGALLFAFATSDFSIVAVAQNSHTSLSMLDKIGAALRSHEGALLLAALVLTLGAALMRHRGSKPMTGAALGTQGLLGVAFFLFVLIASNSFLRRDPPPFEGIGPDLHVQSPAIAFHR